jgi:hypothetical protein
VKALKALGYLHFDPPHLSLNNKRSLNNSLLLSLWWGSSTHNVNLNMRHSFMALLLLFALFSIVNARQDRLNCRTRSNATIVENVLAAQPQYGGTSKLITHLREPWPLEVRHGHSHRVVRYCYCGYA